MATKADLQQACNVINNMVGAPLEPHGTDPGGKFKANPGCYHLGGAYGGYGLIRICDDGRGCDEVIGGHMPKAELYGKMMAFISGLRAKKE